MENLTNYYLLARRALLNSEYGDVIEYYKKFWLITQTTGKPFFIPTALN